MAVGTGYRILSVLLALLFLGATTPHGLCTCPDGPPAAADGCCEGEQGSGCEGGSVPDAPVKCPTPCDQICCNHLPAIQADASTATATAVPTGVLVAVTTSALATAAPPALFRPPRA